LGGGGLGGGGRGGGGGGGGQQNRISVPRDWRTGARLEILIREKAEQSKKEKTIRLTRGKLFAEIVMKRMLN